MIVNLIISVVKQFNIVRNKLFYSKIFNNEHTDQPECKTLFQCEKTKSILLNLLYYLLRILSSFNRLLRKSKFIVVFNFYTKHREFPDFLILLYFNNIFSYPNCLLRRIDYTRISHGDLKLWAFCQNSSIVVHKNVFHRSSKNL